MRTHAKRFLIVGLLLAVAVTGDNLAQAQSCNVEWTGNAGDGLWSTAYNWSTNHVPGPTSDVCIVAAPPTPYCSPAGCVDARGTPSISVHSILVDQGSWLYFGSGTVSIATSLTIQGYEAGGGASSGVLQWGTNLNVPSVQVGDSSHAGTFDAYGTVEGSITNNGSVFPNGSLTVTGNYTQTTGGELYENWHYGEVLNVNGNATLVRLLIPVHQLQVSPEAGLDRHGHDVRLVQRKVYARQRHPRDLAELQQEQRRGDVQIIGRPQLRLRNRGRVVRSLAALSRLSRNALRSIPGQITSNPEVN